MSDSISRQAAIDTLDKHLRMTDVPVSYPGIISALAEWLNELPSAQPERKKGEWIDISDGVFDAVRCNMCGKIKTDPSDFCPNCGADMRGEEDEMR